VLLYLLLNATQAAYRCLLFLRGKNGGFVPNCGFSLSFSSFSEGTLSYNILKKVPKDTVRVGDDGLSGRAKNAPI